MTEWLRNQQQFAVLAVFILAFLEAFVGIGLFISGAILLTVSTLLYVEEIATLYQILPLAFLGAFLGDHSGFYIGRFMGPKFYRTPFAIKRAKMLKKTEQNLNKYGVFTIFIGRFLTPVRSITPLVTGLSGMARARYTLFDFIACVLWSACLGLLVVGLDQIWKT